MAVPIDPPRTPLAPVNQVLAEAALQRQTMLQEAIGGKAAAVPEPPGTAQRPEPTPAGKAAPGATAMPPEATHEAGQLNLSAQARASLQPPPAARQGTPATAAGPVAAAPWPAQGVPAPTRQLLAELLRQIPLPGNKPAQLLAAHPWPAELAHAPLGDAHGAPPGLPALRTWLVAEGQAYTPQGTRAFSLVLRLPLAWVQWQQQGTGTPASAMAPLARPLLAAFGGAPQALDSSTFALALQSGKTARTSALLTLEFVPLAASPVYGRELLRSTDPWLQLAALQASGQWRQQALEDEATPQRRPCHEPGCPYEGRAPCVQPFCLALRVPGASG